MPNAHESCAKGTTFLLLWHKNAKFLFLKDKLTGNVAQVFVSDESWKPNLAFIYQTLNSKEHLIFKVRDPTYKAWKEYEEEDAYQKIEIFRNKKCRMLERALKCFRRASKLSLDLEV